MKHITKQQPPQALIAWTHAKDTNEDGATSEWGYDNMESPLRDAVKGSLLREQGGLCCYTGRRVTMDTSHIEHLKPQAICVHHQDTDYKNLLAAYPSANTKTECAYGAHQKKDWYDLALFVHPLRSDCEKRFKYRDNGNIAPANPNDAGAKETIRRLKLDNRELKNLRETAIDAAIFEEKLTKGQAQRLRDAMDQRNGHGQYREFCFAIKQACERYLKHFD